MSEQPLVQNGAILLTLAACANYFYTIPIVLYLKVIKADPGRTARAIPQTSTAFFSFRFFQSGTVKYFFL